MRRLVSLAVWAVSITAGFLIIYSGIHEFITAGELDALKLTVHLVAAYAVVYVCEHVTGWMKGKQLQK